MFSVSVLRATILTQEGHSGEPFPFSNSGASKDTELLFWDVFPSGPPVPFCHHIVGRQQTNENIDL